MLRITVILATLAVTQGVTATEVLTIDDFEYAGVEEVRAAWRPAENSDPVELMARKDEIDGKALKLPCPFPREDVNRAVYDVDIDLDLTRYGTIVFDFYADDVNPIRSCTIYFRTENGWYGHGFQPVEGWRPVSLSRGAFRTEDSPDGWDKIEGIRICAWKARPEPTFCAVDNLAAQMQEIVVVRGTPEDSEAGTARDCAARMSEYLTDVGIPQGAITDEDVAGGALEGRKMAIFAYSPGLGDDAAAQVEEFVNDGGKIIVFYSVHTAVADLLGLAEHEHKNREYDGQFAEIALDQEALAGLPKAILQNSWNIQDVTPSDDARVVGHWRDNEGKETGPAVIVSDSGAYIGHILTAADAEPKARLILALVGHFVPEAWHVAANHALSGAESVGPFKGHAELRSHLEEKMAGEDYEADVAEKLRAAEQARQKAQQLMEQEQYAEVIEQAAEVDAALSSAYVLAHEPRDGEFRAVWNHSGTGDCGDWETAMQHLAEGNFNAVVPNMWWGGVAHYDSEYLPHSKTFEEHGDQIAQAVAAGKEYGIEVHPWKVNWNLGWAAPEEFVGQMREEGRLQKDVNGEEIRWLCPSHPKNFQLELDTMLEVARKYDVDGVHFDYIRYPHGNACYCDGCRKRFEEYIGHKVENWPEACHSGELSEEYRDWRCYNITRLVRATSEQAHEMKPHIKVSAAVFSSYPNCKDSIGQDWVLWCKEGWLDFVCPMNYTQSDADFRRRSSNQIGYVGDAVPLYTGIGHFRIPDEQAIGQMEISRSVGSDGFILFNMGRALAEKGMPKFAKGVTGAKAVLPHNAPEFTFETKFDNDQPIVEVTSDRLKMTVSLDSLGAHRKEAVGARGYIVVQDMMGNGIEMLGRLPGVGAQEAFSIVRQEGPFRVVARGELKFADGTRQWFLRRSRPYEFVEE